MQELAVALVAASIATACGSLQSSRLECGAGTVPDGDRCVAVMNCADGTERVDDKCVPVEGEQPPPDEPETDPPPPDAGVAPDVVTEFGALVDHACACPDVQCLAGITNKFTDIAEKISKAANTMSADDNKRLGEMAQRYATCAQSLANRASTSGP